MSEITVPNYDDLILDGLSLFSPAQVNRSIWTGARKVVGLSGAELWRGTATIDTLATEDAERPWRAFLFALRGQVNWFRWYLPCNTHIGPKPTVLTSATGYSLALTGMQASAMILRAGQFITVPLPSGKFRAVCLNADLYTDIYGSGTATFDQMLPEAPTVAAVVETANPWIAMSLTEAVQGFSYDQGVAGTSFGVEEAR